MQIISYLLGDSSSFLEELGKLLNNLVRKIRRLPEVDKDSIKAILQELQRALLMADVNVEICLATHRKH